MATARSDGTASSHRRAFIVEVMGRHCGYLALMAAIATVFARYAGYFVPMGDGALRGVAPRGWPGPLTRPGRRVCGAPLGFGP